MIRLYPYLRSTHFLGAILVSLFNVVSCSNSEQNLLAPGAEIYVSANDSNVPAALREAYKEDAAMLTVRLMHEHGGSQAQEVEPPPPVIHDFYCALIRVFNATSIAARDSVVSIYDIHSVRNVQDLSLRSLILWVSYSTDWVSAWINGERFTGNTEIDGLMEQFDLELGNTKQRWGSFQVVLIAGRPLNISALATRFKAIDGIVLVEPNGYGGDGDNITATVYLPFIFLDYSVGYGDCPAGCISRRYWGFRVSIPGYVSYRGSWGDPAP